MYRASHMSSGTTATKHKLKNVKKSDLMTTLVASTYADK